MKEPTEENILKGMICPYCLCTTKTVTCYEIYGQPLNNNPKIIQCVENNDHYVGTNANGRALGRLANLDLRKLRMKAHSLFDALWKGPARHFRTRDRAYRWLANEMELSKEQTHFAMFDEHQCNRAIEIIEALLNEQRDDSDLHV